MDADRCRYVPGPHILVVSQSAVQFMATRDDSKAQGYSIDNLNRTEVKDPSCTCQYLGSLTDVQRRYIALPTTTVDRAVAS